MQVKHLLYDMSRKTSVFACYLIIQIGVADDRLDTPNPRLRFASLLASLYLDQSLPLSAQSSSRYVVHHATRTLFFLPSIHPVLCPSTLLCDPPL